MKLRLACGLEFAIVAIARGQGRTAVKVWSPRLLTAAESREADALIADALFAGEADPVGLVLEPDPAKLNAAVRAFVAGAMERN